jgi:hypothetical protein
LSRPRYCGRGGPVTDDLPNATQESAHGQLLFDEARYWTSITPESQQLLRVSDDHLKVAEWS